MLEWPTMLTYFTRFFLVISLALWPLSSLASKAERKKSSYDLPVSSAQFRYIRVYLFGGIRELEIKTTSPYTVTDKINRKLLSGEFMTGTVIRPASNGIQFGGQLLRNLPINFESQGDGFRIQGHTYRHILQIRVEADGTLLIVNEIPIEDYLKSVLPSEMSAEWPIEALKAQAVAARTYALFKMIENQNEKFDLRKDVISQSYKGKALERIASTRAVKETQGQVLSYRGKVFPSFFHSTCGGHTANIADLWDMQEHPSLRGVECD
ncbi:MAG: SpoIID/LytB domain-containing protein, partial [Candidatus Omnitrophica bacterium]|nr:SpoIID/LytB domain-containing protein [Candidatus Omnitrophota bacterium]